MTIQDSNKGKNMFSKKILLTSLTAAILATTASITLAASKQDAAAKIPPAVVSAIKVTQKPWQQTISATGTLSASKGITVKAEAQGRLKKIFFQSGQMIKKGEPLVEINPDILKAQLEQTQAQLHLSQLDYNRNLKLYKQHFVSKADLDKSKASLDGYKAQIQEFLAKLDQTLIRAPFTGKLGLKQVSIGDYLNLGQAIVDLQALDPIRVDFSVPQTYLTKLNLGDKIAIQSEAIDGKFTGSVYAFNSIVDQSTRMLNLRANVPNKENKLVPGTFVEVTLFLGQPQNVIIAPQTAIVYDPDGNYVYKLENHKAVKANVILGQKLPNNEIIIQSGLQDGDNIISGGQTKLHDGSPVMTTAESKAAFSQHK
jgi:membrane fusion protein, multidrug efflux system